MTTTTHTREVLVASVPENHVYVRHLSSASDDGVRRLAVHQGHRVHCRDRLDEPLRDELEGGAGRHSGGE